MKVFVQVLGTETGDSTPTLLIFFDAKRYLFNCGEGTQRFCTEHRVRLARIENIFLTRLSWDNIGGLPGSILTITDVGVKKINLFGPPNTLNFVEATRYFISRWDLTLNVKEYSDDSSEPADCYQDDCLKVVPILVVAGSQKSDFSSFKRGFDKLQTTSEISSQVSSHQSQYGHTGKESSHFRYLDADCELGTKGTFVTQLKQTYGVSEDPECPTESFQDSARGRIPPLHKKTRDTKPVDSVICYACHAADIPGKFDAALSVKLGVPLKSRSLLVKGQPVTLEDGRVIQPSDCISPATPGRIMIIAHCPNLDLLQELVNHQGFAAYQENQRFSSQVACIIHMTPSDIINNDMYQRWMAKFDPNVQHIIVNAQHCPSPIVFESSAANQIKLNQMHPTIFPKAFETRKPQMALPNILIDQNAMNSQTLKLVAAEPLMKFHLSPAAAVGLDLSEIRKELNPEEIMIAAHKSSPALKGNMEQLQIHIDAERQKILNAAEPILDPIEVVFLGTGAALPSKYRNVSSTYIHIKNYGGLLLDAGEGTYGQLSRHFHGEAEANQVIANLKCVFISHMHADHHLGLIRIMLRRQELCNDPLLLITPPHYKNWITEYSQIQHLNYILVNAYDLFYPVPMEGLGSMTCQNRNFVQETLLKTLGISEVHMIPVIHCPDAFGVTITHKDGWKVVFSGDTRPCALLDEAGKNCNLLIHEATFEDQLTTEAIEKNHATTTEAIQSAVNMNAGFLMLTHFSQRYPKIPVFDERYGARTGVAFDLMKVSFADFGILPHFLECLKNFFDEEPLDMDEENAEEEKQTHQVPPNKKLKKK